MNRLINKAPKSITIDGADYKINTNFRDVLQTVQALNDKDLTDSEKIEILIHNIYDEIPSDIEKAIKEAISFLRCGKEIDDNKEAENLCDFDKDADYIYQAMLKKGIDLDTHDDLHWWTFMSHFAEIGESTFSRIVYLRMRKNRGKLTKDERKECDSIGWNVINMQDGSLDDEILAYLQGKD